MACGQQDYWNQMTALKGLSEGLPRYVGQYGDEDIAAGAQVEVVGFNKTEGEKYYPAVIQISCDGPGVHQAYVKSGLGTLNWWYFNGYWEGYMNEYWFQRASIGDRVSVEIKNNDSMQHNFRVFFHCYYIH